MKDLEPYICLFENCSEPQQLYRDRTSWLSHMRNHAVKWTCSLRTHKPQTFDTEGLYDQHMQSDHTGRFPPSQLAALKKRSQRPSTSLFDECPLCKKGYYAQSQMDSSTKLNPHQSAATIAHTQTRLQKHLTFELQRMALYCIPHLEGDEESISSEDPDNRRIHESTIDKVPSITFGDMDTSTDDYLLDEYANILSETTEVPSSEMTSITDWEFVSQQKWEKFPDHAKDPRLERLVRKCQIEALMAIGKASDPDLPCRLGILERNKDFYGRESLLAELSQKLCSKGNPPMSCSSMNIVALQGTSGVGKTQTALEFVHRNAHNFDAVFWCHADEINKLSTDYDRIAINLGLVPEASGDSRDQALTRVLVKEWLEDPLKSYDENKAPERASWLLILDNMTNGTQNAVLSKFFPTRGTSGSILITCPDESAAANFETIKVSPFTPDEAAGFLTKLTKKRDSPEERHFGSIIGRRVGGSPHELTLVARIINEKIYTFAEIEAQSESDSQKAVLQLNLNDLKAESDQLLFSKWALDVLEDGLGLLDVLSMFDPDGVPERLLIVSNYPGVMKDYPHTFEDYQDARSELIGYSLITRDRENECLHVHRSVQKAARSRMSFDRYCSVFYTCVSLLNKAYPSLPFTWRHSVSHWPEIQQLFDHIVRLREFSRPIKVTSHNIVGAFEYAKLCAEVGWYVISTLSSLVYH